MAGQWGRCGGLPEFVGPRTFQYPRHHVALIYVCEEHLRLLPEWRRITESD